MVDASLHLQPISEYRYPACAASTILLVLTSASCISWPVSCTQRAAVLTSRLSIRTGVYNNLTTIPPHTGDHRVFHPNSVNGLPPEEITVAETLS